MEFDGSYKQDFSSSGDDQNFMSSNRQYSESLETILDLQQRPSNDVIVFSHRSSHFGGIPASSERESSFNKPHLRSTS